MKEHYKKMIAPILITLFLVLQQLIIGVLILIPAIAEMSEIGEVPAYTIYIMKVAFYGLPIITVCLGMKVLLERIKEIRSGEEDDLSKY